VKFSIVIPAHNEEAFIGACLDSVVRAAKEYENQYEVIVAINRCSDRTEEIVRSYGALIVYEHSRNMARIRNAAARRASGDILITIDADSRMSPNALEQIDRFLSRGTYIGGGVAIVPERVSIGILVSLAMLAPYVLYHRVSGGLFWCIRRDFEDIGGFDERLVSGEDVDFSKRLRAYGKTVGKKSTMLWRAHIVTSCRKFDKFGDWYVVRHPRTAWKILHGRSEDAANMFYYDVER
jgi:glycosyltransferase involved in cell wall biosynthesis